MEAVRFEQLLPDEEALCSRVGVQVSLSRVPTSSGCISALRWGEGPPVVLLHPLGFFAAHWLPLVPHLGGFRVFALDAPAHGRSDPLILRGADLRTAFVAAYREALGALGVERAVLVGNSLGGLTAMWLALSDPGLVAGLVVLGVPAVGLPGVRPDWMMKALATPWLGALMVAMPAPNPLVERMLRRALGPRAAASAPPEILRLHWRFRQRRAWITGVRTILRCMMAGPRVRPEMHLSADEMARIVQPTRFVWGDADPYGEPTLTDAALTVMRRASLRVLPGGHLPQLDDPAAVAALVRETAREAGLREER